MQPTRQDQAIGQVTRTLRQCNKHALRDVLSQVRVANHAQSRRIHMVNVPAHQFGKRRFRSPGDEIAQ